MRLSKPLAFSIVIVTAAVLVSGAIAAPWLTRGQGAASDEPVSAPPRFVAGFKPRPQFSTPGKAAYCYVDGANLASWRPRLFCWTPNDGYGVHLVYGGGRPRAFYYDEPSPIADGYDSLVSWAPAAPVLRFGETRKLRCPDISDYSTCRWNGPQGRVAITCSSRSSGLTCVNTTRHGFWLGRYRGVRRW